MITRSGNIQFTIDHIKALFEISQSLDMRKRPEIKDLQLELGNIQVSDYVILCLYRNESPENEITISGSLWWSRNIGLHNGIFSQYSTEFIALSNNGRPWKSSKVTNPTIDE